LKSVILLDTRLGTNGASVNDGVIAGAIRMARRTRSWTTTSAATVEERIDDIGSTLGDRPWCGRRARGEIMSGRSVDHLGRLAAAVGEELMSRRALLSGAAAAAFGSWTVPAGAQPSAARPPAIRRGGDLRVAWLDTVDTLDPHFTSSLGAIKIHDNIYNGLLKVDFDGRRVSFVPELVEKWSIPDPVTHLLTLRRGVRFHDGEELTAEVVQWNQERLRDKRVGSPHGWKLAYLDRIQVLDRYRLKITFTKPYQFLLVAWTGSTGRAGTIVSPRAVERHGPRFGRNPVGTGPFRLADWIDNDRLVLERNPHYFEPGADGKPLPYLDRVTIRLKSDSHAALAELLAGEIHGMNLVPFDLLSALERRQGIQLVGGVEGNYTYVGMNNRRPPFDDAALRRAVACAIDRAPIVAQAYRGGAIQACSAVSPPMTYFYNPEQCASKRAQRFDLERAQAYRAQSRHHGEVDAEWIVTAHPTGSGGVGTRIAELIRPMLARIGVRVRITLLDEATWHRRRNAGEFQIYDEGWVADLDPDETLYPEWATGRPWNFVGYSNPEFDRLVSEAQFEPDVAKRKALYDRADLLLAEDAPCAFLAHLKVFKALAPQVRGFKYIPADSMRFHTVHLGT
jgi:peptide/nickel transport system substrate-binding protein